MSNETTIPILSFNINNPYPFISIKLTPTNYIFWRTQITLFLKTQNLIGFVDGTYQCPPSTHPNYALWVQQDQLIMSLLIASLSEEIFPKVIGLETSHDIWATLEKAYAMNNSQSVFLGDDQAVSHMHSSLYKSVQVGDLVALRENKLDQLSVQLTPNKNTLLHVVVQFHDSPECINEILDHMQSSSVKQSMLLRKNSKGETALHIAAQNGRSKIVEALIERAKALDNEEGIESGAKIAKEMMRATDQNGDTALHGAVRNKHAQVVKLLVQEDPEFPHPSNKMEETPLYLAIENFSGEIVSLILTTCKSPSYKGPGGKSALHAAAMFVKWEDCIEELLKRNQALTKEVDECGWSPLHYAARFNCVSTVKRLLQVDISAAYIMAAKDDNKTPLHVAAWRGHVEVMKELLKHCPDCWEMTTSKGQNVLHLAIDYERQPVINFILSNSWAANVINQKDVEGNTPLHLYAISYDLDGRRLVEPPGADTNAFNAQNSTPLYMVDNLQHNSLYEESIKAQLKKKGGTRGYRNVVERDNHGYTRWKKHIADKEKRIPVDFRKKGDTQLIAATLIATVTFAAGFTVPGGYEGNEGPNQGMAVLARKAAFKAFVVSDTIAVAASLLAVILLFAASLHEDRAKVVPRYASALGLVQISTIAMTVAFITGLYTVLAPSSLGLAISICFFATCCILVVFFILYRLYKEEWMVWRSIKYK